MCALHSLKVSAEYGKHGNGFLAFTKENKKTNKQTNTNKLGYGTHKKKSVTCITKPLV